MKPCDRSSEGSSHGLVKCSVVGASVSPSIVCYNCQIHWQDGKPPNTVEENEVLRSLPTLKTAQPPIQPERVNLVSLSKMISNFTGAMVRWVSSGFKTVSEEKFKSRLEICKQCSHWQNERCTICGCTGLKLHIATEQCPIGKWEKES